MLGSTITFSLYRYVSQGLTRRTDKYLKCGVAGYSSPGNGATFVAMTTAGVAITASAWTVANLCFFNMESRNHDDEQNYSHFCDNTLLATTGKICLTSNVWLLYPLRSSHPINRTGCDAGLAHSHLLEAMDPEVEDDSGYTEAERFSQCLDYHRSLLLDYCRRWPSGPETGSPSNVNECHILSKNNTNNHVANNSLSAQKWPRNVPRDDEVSALECDLGYAERSTMYRQEPKSCHDAKFRLASNYLSQTTNTEEKRQRGFCIIKELAEQGHPDSMCYYGTTPCRHFVFVVVSSHCSILFVIRCTTKRRTHNGIGKRKYSGLRNVVVAMRYRSSAHSSDL